MGVERDEALRSLHGTYAFAANAVEIAASTYDISDTDRSGLHLD